MPVPRASSAPHRRKRPGSGIVHQPEHPLVESPARHESLSHSALLVDASVSYWEHIDPRSSLADRIDEARRDHWFGTSFQSNHLGARLKEMAARYDAFPHALRLLQWIPVPVELRPLVCHVHLALADARYRRFTGEYLAERRERELGPTQVDFVANWLRAHEPSLPHRSTYAMLARRLLDAAREAGLVDSDGAARELGPKHVPGPAIAYVLYLLREVQLTGTLRENAYLRGLGIVEEKQVAEAIAAAPGVRDAARAPGHAARVPGHAAALERDGGVVFEEAGLLEWGERYWASASAPAKGARPNDSPLR